MYDYTYTLFLIIYYILIIITGKKYHRLQRNDKDDRISITKEDDKYFIYECYKCHIMKDKAAIKRHLKAGQCHNVRDSDFVCACGKKLKPTKKGKYHKWYCNGCAKNRAVMGPDEETKFQQLYDEYDLGINLCAFVCNAW